MTTPAVSSSLSGIAAAQSQMNAAAQSAARSGVMGDGDGDGDLVDSVVGGMNAELGQAVNIALLRRSMDMEKSIIDILA